MHIILFLKIIQEHNGFIKVKSKLGGARPGAGRPPGRKSSITIDGLLEQVQLQFGKPYDQVLIEDFKKAASNNDHNLTMKYHNILVNKLMHNMTKVEISEDIDQVDLKRMAFSDALKTLTTITESIEKGGKHE